MYRYCVIPIILITCCHLFIPFYFIEAEAMYAIMGIAQGAPATHFNTTFWNYLFDRAIPETGIWAIITGLIFSFAAITWDLLRNGVVDRTGVKTILRLIPNLFWCSIYALLGLGFNTLLIVGIYFSGISPVIELANRLPFEPLLVVGAINLVAFLWAVVRSINAADVLTPSVLLNKARRSMQLQEVR